MQTMEIPPTEQKPKRSLRILHADDEIHVRVPVELKMQREGHSYTGAENGAEALSILDSVGMDDFDLVITDNQMPVMDGLRFLEELRKRGFRGKVMVFCSELRGDRLWEFRRFSPDGFLNKPAYPSDIMRAIAELFPGEAPR